MKEKGRERKCEMKRRRRREAKAFGQSQDRLQMLSLSLSSQFSLPLSLLILSPCALLSSLISDLSFFHTLSHPFLSYLTFPFLSSLFFLLFIHPQRRDNVGQQKWRARSLVRLQTFTFSSEGQHQREPWQGFFCPPRQYINSNYELSFQVHVMLA